MVNVSFFQPDLYLWLQKFPVLDYTYGGTDSAR